MKQFDIIRYMKSSTGYSFTDDVLETIVMKRGLEDVETFEDLSQRDKDLLLADMLFVLYTTPTQTASVHKQHGNAAQTIGSQYISDKKHIYELMMKLYKRWGDAMADIVDQGGVSWID